MLLPLYETDATIREYIIPFRVGATVLTLANCYSTLPACFVALISQSIEVKWIVCCCVDLGIGFGATSNSHAEIFSVLYCVFLESYLIN